MNIFWDAIQAICGTCIAVAVVSLLAALILWELHEYRRYTNNR